jgi:hypothetical protein
MSLWREIGKETREVYGWDLKRNFRMASKGVREGNQRVEFRRISNGIWEEIWNGCFKRSLENSE